MSERYHILDSIMIDKYAEPPETVIGELVDAVKKIREKHPRAILEVSCEIRIDGSVPWTTADYVASNKREREYKLEQYNKLKSELEL